ncbi:bifunctional phosphopantothenoylcysteine decarboxylase/phosphopantothenate--cysteine ligase CoaBC [Pontibacillus sp. HMF3514]|uniref:bifunctional phosphopantothenoylcysteine decarboxylase/phosphopantothenate--cysteine ligase CoaBC n=1 Tax=Pontibacillus sp. HMF3514 TaxID=2692425 RepID=UPI00131FBA31|nr:bifunctional phosphopantothenoylcysteine decarboxylase/phosphopantothenate--cysteine ligase CoaBC [Pontibacillus sp. HMF3514]QHE52140.1 bifunctional phosphopantothenoylcysteine decarboxylase/phosphopantothenate--cysteine ligase CoaBC [Pontibacillus sp. HMF3514]
MLKGKNVLLGVSGGIAAYKACALTSKLVQAGANVTVVMTKSSQEFVTPLTFQALSRNPVYTDTFDEKIPEQIAHIDIADWADLIVLAPATANLLGKVANGIADDMLTTTLLASVAPVYVAPAMNVHMYAHQAVQDNLKRLESFGYRFIEPGDGYLACGYVGKGRLEEPETIVSVLEKSEESSSLLKGKRVLITAGPTHEEIDPVRFFTNHSSGKMGYAFAKQATLLGAEVILVSGPTNLDPPKGVNVIQVHSAHEMYERVLEHYEEQDIIIKAAAVADYKPKHTYDQKMKKKDGNLVIEMERTQDILKALGERKQHQFLVGFAAETQDPYLYGKQKLEKKNLDAIVVNNISSEGAGFGGDTNIVSYLNRQGEQKDYPLLSKDEVAYEILHRILDDLKDVQK